LTLCSVKWNRYKGVKFGVHDVIGSFITAFRKSNIYMECVTGSGYTKSIDDIAEL
jgi:hypothetical protein